MVNDQFRAVKNQFIASAFTACCLFLLLQLIFYFYPIRDAWAAGSLIALAAFLLQLLTGICQLFVTFRTNREILENIDVFVKTLASGKLSARLDIREQGILTQIGRSLNELADRQDNQVKSLQRLVDENSEMGSRIRNEAVLAERQRLARDLHDAVSQQLFALSMLASAAEKSIRTNPRAAAENIADVADIARKAQGEMRALLLHLRPVRLTEESLDKGLARLIRELDGKTAIRFTADIQPVHGLSKGVENQLFRISQEALSNALRHSEATRVNVALFGGDQSVTLTVYDNGRGFDPHEERIASYGLKTMRERAEEIGGNYLLTTHEQEGTSIRIRVPVQKETAEDGKNQCDDC